MLNITISSRCLLLLRGLEINAFKPVAFYNIGLDIFMTFCMLTLQLINQCTPSETWTVTVLY